MAVRVGVAAAREVETIPAARRPSDGSSSSAASMCEGCLGLRSEELAKAQLAVHIRDAIKRRRLTQAEAARLVGLDQPKISALMNGRLTGFSSDRLLRCLTALGQDVEIVVRVRTGHRARGHLKVIDHAA